MSVYVDWGGRVKLDWLGVPAALPPVELITSVHSFCFHEGKVMLVELNHRGMDIPGGHREAGESAEAAVLRETLEEGYVRGRCRLVGLVRVDNSENAGWRPGRYPLVGYQAYYRIDVDEILPFAAEFESARRVFVRPAEAAGLHHSWNPMLAEGLRAALAEAEG
jgi:8-oxo-dGTP diphosphatase